MGILSYVGLATLFKRRKSVGKPTPPPGVYSHPFTHPPGQYLTRRQALRAFMSSVHATSDCEFDGQETFQLGSEVAKSGEENFLFSPGSSSAHHSRLCPRRPPLRCGRLVEPSWSAELEPDDVGWHG